MSPLAHFFFTQWEGVTKFWGPGYQKQRIAMKFGMLVIGLGENDVSFDELTQRKKFFDTLMEQESRRTITLRAC